MRKKNRTAVLALLLAAGIAAAGCGTNPADEKQDGQTQTDGGADTGTEKGSSAQDKEPAAGTNAGGEAADTETDSTAQAGDSAAGTNTGDADIENDSSAQDKESASETEGGETGVKDSGSEEKTEIRREDYPDCDGSGHGDVEIYYSDGTVETEEY